MKHMELKNEYNALINSLRLLVLPFDEQKSCLPSFADVKDEVLNIFFEAFLRIPPIVEKGIIPYNAIASILRLNNEITLIELDESLKSLAAFIDSKEWNHIRKLADIALTELGEKNTPPDLEFISWIAGH
ncbi:hypothetical protein HF329_32025 [Chitinophaga oryzae]|uniref:Uncharacterized protein n=1 Tax=Chitinophaga oryzae TaxID=2725414 RepID=A0AAE6ZLY5_9BACT|nr:hypothetical protein [Chitinophaga oryzae]QJB35679.1 hypothetical protein HF329_32025 [Chitinophaga oryzae]